MRIIIIPFFISQALLAQQTLSIDSVVAQAIRFHPLLQAADWNIKQQQALKAGSFSLADPAVIMESPSSEFFTIGAQQGFENPLVYVRQSQLGRSRVELSRSGLRLSSASVEWQVRQAYLQLQLADATWRQAFLNDSLASALSAIALRRHAAGDIGLLEKVRVETVAQEAAVGLSQANAERSRARQQLATLIGIAEGDLVSTSPLAKQSWSGNSNKPDGSTIVMAAEQRADIARGELKVQSAEVLPGFSVGYLNQGDANSSVPHRFQFGISVPLWFWTHGSDIKAARAAWERSRSESAATQLEYSNAWADAISQFSTGKASVEYYEASGLKQSDIILDAATRSYTAGEIGYVEYLAALTQVFDIRGKYNQALFDYNSSVIRLNYLNQ